jgi:hypothetical protein
MAILNFQSVAIGNDWHTNYPTEHILMINDISLPNGGKFDIDGSWRGSHQTHREGEDADLRSSIYDGDRYIDNNNSGNYDVGIDELIDRNNNGIYDSSILEGFKSICERVGIDCVLEYPDNRGEGNEHWHLNF